jgi:hypothetical protein
MFGSDGLVAVVVGLGHVSTFSDKYERRKKGSITTMGAAGRAPIGWSHAVSKRDGGEAPCGAICGREGLAKVTRS